MNTSPLVPVSDVGPIRWLTLRRPARRLVPTGGWNEITAALKDFTASEQRVIVLTGSAADFCSGAFDLDLDQPDDLRRPAVGCEYTKGPSQAATTVHRLSKPSIAAVDGACYRSRRGSGRWPREPGHCR